MPISDERTAELRENRGAVYGRDPRPGFENTGRIWGAILSDWFGRRIADIPPHVVSLMIAGLKSSRAARPTEKRDHDSYEDAVVYLKMAEDLDPTLPGRSEDDART